MAATIKEGSATILFPSKNEVFYNPVQEFNRDLSVAAFSTFHNLLKQEKNKKNPNGELTILEALSATGLRSIRYAKEVPGIVKIVANDLEPKAVENIATNIRQNNVDSLVFPNLADANSLMHNSKGIFNVIDLDPYGSAAPFIETAIGSISDGGLLAVTCTDLAVLCGAHPEVCFAKYGGNPTKGAPFVHEMALRLLLSSLESSAARHGKYIEPLLSASIDFYIRVFVRVHKSALNAKLCASKKSVVFVCQNCKSFELQPLGRISPHKNNSNPSLIHYSVSTLCLTSKTCSNCNIGHWQMGGPVYNGPLHSKDFLSSLLLETFSTQRTTVFGTQARMLGMLNVIKEELDDCPLFYTLSSLSGTLHTVTPSLLEFNSALLHLGYKVSISHCDPVSIKTNAPNNVIWDVMRSWVKNHPIKNISEKSPAAFILSLQQENPSEEKQINFNPHPFATPPSKQIKLVRFQENPTANWGPKARARSPSSTCSSQQQQPEDKEEEESMEKKIKN